MLLRFVWNNCEWNCFSLQDAHEIETKPMLLQLSLTFPPLEDATVNWDVLLKMTSQLMKSNQRHGCAIYSLLFMNYFYVLYITWSQLGNCNEDFIWNSCIIVLFDLFYLEPVNLSVYLLVYYWMLKTCSIG